MQFLALFDSIDNDLLLRNSVLFIKLINRKNIYRKSLFRFLSSLITLIIILLTS